MTNTELSWAKSQSWWNDLQKIYECTAISNAVSLIEFLEANRLEMFAIHIIKDIHIDYLQSQALAKIAAACIDHVDLEDCKASVSRTSKTRLFEYRRNQNLVAKLECDHVLLAKEQESVFEQLSSKGVVWDHVVNKGGDYFEFYANTATLTEL